MLSREQLSTATAWGLDTAVSLKLTIPRTDVWSAASGGAETSSQFRDGRRRAPFRPTSATITGERDRFRPLAPPVAVWAAVCGGVAGVWPRRRDRAPWAGCGRGGERVSSARGCASCPSVSPDGPTGPPLLRGGASHEAEGRHGARRGGAGRCCMNTLWGWGGLARTSPDAVLPVAPAAGGGPLNGRLAGSYRPNIP